MSKTLIVMRHAKSSWDRPVSDIERSLNERGRNGAVALGDWLHENALEPDEILCSSAERTQETARCLKLAAPITSSPALYMAPAEVLLKHAARATGDTVLLVAHNPGIGELAERLANQIPTHPRFLDYPSGATTVFSCDLNNWDDLRFGSATPRHFTTPRDLI